MKNKLKKIGRPPHIRKILQAKKLREVLIDGKKMPYRKIGAIMQRDVRLVFDWCNYNLESVVDKV